MIFFIIWKVVLGSAEVQRSGDFVIEPGQGAISIWQQLKSEGYITRTLPARYHSALSGVASSLKAGTYQLQAGETIRGIVQRFAAGDTLPDEVTLTFPEGFTLAQMAQRVEAIGLATAGDYTAQATVGNYQEQFDFLAGLPEQQSLEGYLFPDTYHVSKDDTASDIIQKQLATFRQKAVNSLLTPQAVSARNRTLSQIVNMASIIEREVIKDDDMALVSGVLWKRIDDATGLYADATIRYALDKPTGPLTAADLAVDSPYNTRLYNTLPPTPISNPSTRAIQAALNPEPSDFYYYLSAPDGTTIFSKTNDEHNINKGKYLQ